METNAVSNRPCMNQYLWVYGTLRHGECNAHYLSTATYVGSATCDGTLYDTGQGYPAFTRDAITSEAVYGELYIIDEKTLANVDELEDYFGPNDERNEYDRVLLTVFQNGISLEAWGYEYANKEATLMKIASGDWKRLAKMAFHNLQMRNGRENQ
ncbi:MAG: gamma-glutamylcyclotransferase family protein [Bacilli bacterium]